MRSRLGLSEPGLFAAWWEADQYAALVLADELLELGITATTEALVKKLFDLQSEDRRGLKRRERDFASITDTDIEIDKLLRQRLRGQVEEERAREACPPEASAAQKKPPPGMYSTGKWPRRSLAGADGPKVRQEAEATEREWASSCRRQACFCPG